MKCWPVSAQNASGAFLTLPNIVKYNNKQSLIQQKLNYNNNPIAITILITILVTIIILITIPILHDYNISKRIIPILAPLYTKQLNNFI